MGLTLKGTRHNKEFLSAAIAEEHSPHGDQRRICTGSRNRGLFAQSGSTSSSCMLGGEVASNVVRVVGDRATASERQDSVGMH